MSRANPHTSHDNAGILDARCSCSHEGPACPSMLAVLASVERNGQPLATGLTQDDERSAS